MELDFSVLIPYFHMFWKGVCVTIQASALGVLFGSVQGVCCLLLGSVCYAVGGAWMHRLMIAMIGAPP